MCFFFFNQKTAYEMRISDWSSDVCSSDLQAVRAAPLCRGDHRRDRWDAAGFRAVLPQFLDLRGQARPLPGGSVRPPRGARVGARQGAARPSRVRKSVVSGKGGAVRLDLGGSRLIKKKKKRQLVN